MRSYSAFTSKIPYQLRLLTSEFNIKRRLDILFLIIALILPSCKEKLTDKQFEQKVLDEVFVKIVDSTYKDRRIYTSFLEIGNGSLKRMERDTFDLIIAVGNAGLINEKTDLQQYNNRKFIFRHLSELPESPDLANWSAKYPKFAGLLFLSNVKFDDKKEYGTLEVSYRCGMNCGLGYLVTIRKIDDRWMISNVKDTWIS